MDGSRREPLGVLASCVLSHDHAGCRAQSREAERCTTRRPLGCTHTKKPPALSFAPHLELTTSFAALRSATNGGTEAPAVEEKAEVIRSRPGCRKGLTLSTSEQGWPPKTLSHKAFLIRSSSRPGGPQAPQSWTSPQERQSTPGACSSAS
jgi:hypothetical protein